MKSPSWRSVANILAERMSHHTYCNDHPEASGDPDCPFCADRAAYRIWERKARSAAAQAPADQETGQ